MTTVPEVTLAKELGMSYASIALVTDYDCWKEDEEVSVESVMLQMKENAKRASQLLINAIPKIAAKNWDKIIKETQVTLIICLFYTSLNEINSFPFIIGPCQIKYDVKRKKF